MSPTHVQEAIKILSNTSQDGTMCWQNVRYVAIFHDSVLQYVSQLASLAFK